MHPFSQEEIELLSRKYKEGTLTVEERIRFTQWYAQLTTTLEHSGAENTADIKERIFKNTYAAIHAGEQLPQQVNGPKGLLVRYRYVTAAAVLLLLAVAVVYYIIPPKTDVDAALVKAHVMPGSDKAILTLANGKVIDLTTAPEGELAIDNNAVVKKQKGGEVHFSGTGQGAGTTANVYNTIHIPKGGQWKLVLNDGTKVWLNAATSLKFPAAFAGKNREIFLEGEGYFEVAENVAHPFIVHTGHQTIEVLGTHFNVNAYTEESNTQTTLLEGSVRINGSALLTPGQKGVSNGYALEVQNADVEQAVAWKEGNFMFNGEDLAGIMRQISRWYKVDVRFQSPELKEITFSGSISRSVPFDKLIHRLSLTKEVSFTIENNTIIVQPYHNPR
ncbi:FecR family protein [Filimonas lacunae]|uniref:FecR family protein n=1 Tax=Filimonas lacunae TaxID=477680 RepID=A0A173MHI5_9BACT|nr:FecR family protein [Filimonas lacunae]BAV06956.1 anti-sigma factor [Filimonas lacunae]SIS97248.1 FecR family protein [Filimonas lacunae]